MQERIRKAIERLEESKLQYEHEVMAHLPMDKRNETFKGYVHAVFMLYNTCIENLSQPVANRGIHKAIDNAKSMLEQHANLLHENGLLGDVFRLYPAGHLLEKVITEGLSSADERLQASAVASIELGGYFLKKRFYSAEFDLASTDVLLKLAQNIVNDIKLQEVEYSQLINEKFSSAQSTICRILREIEMRGELESAIEFLAANEDAILEIGDILKDTEDNIIERFLLGSKNAKTGTLIRHEMPKSYKALRDSGIMKSHIINHMCDEEYDLAETPYPDCLSAEDIAIKVASYFQSGNVIRFYDSINKSFLVLRGLENTAPKDGEGSLFDFMHQIQLVERIQKLARKMLSEIAEKGVDEIADEKEGHKVCVVNSYLMLDFAVNAPGDRLLCDKELQDKWAGYVIASCGQFLTEGIEAGPCQSKQVIKGLLNGAIQVEDVPQHIIESDVFRSVLTDVPEQEGIALIRRYGDWGLLKSINFKSGRINRHRLETDLGL